MECNLIWTNAYFSFFLFLFPCVSMDTWWFPGNSWDPRVKFHDKTDSPFPQNARHSSRDTFVFLLSPSFFFSSRCALRTTSRLTISGKLTYFYQRSVTRVMNIQQTRDLAFRLTSSCSYFVFFFFFFLEAVSSFDLRYLTKSVEVRMTNTPRQKQKNLHFEVRTKYVRFLISIFFAKREIYFLHLVPGNFIDHTR